MIDLETEGGRKLLAQRITEDVDAFCVREFAEEPRKHLGASIIGHACAAYPWLSFRWVNHQIFSGRMYRLFNRGHTEEARFVRWLAGIEFAVREVDPDTGKQYRISGVKGHFGGSLDGLAMAPARYEIKQPGLFVAEFKTHSGKSFEKLKSKGVAISKPQHLRQFTTYGKAYDVKYGLYLAVNKDNDELWPEVIKLDYTLADDMFRRADNTINSQTCPPKIAHTEAYSECKYCDFSAFCHKGAIPAKNCRSCKQAYPIDGGQWLCKPRNQIIPDEVIEVGCPGWENILA